ncbi:MAG: ATP-binding protein [Candidatus Latescibacteria bacterium]|nr:ATP-binding protein [Candidatus Latescibacterota bacterium]
MPDGGTIDIDVATVHYDGVGIHPNAMGDYLRIDIRDTGIGIAPQHLHRIFDPYFSTKKQGRGLGLATSYSILKRHAGHLEVASTPAE